MESEPTNDIILPKELTTGAFTLEQIGTICVLMAIPTLKPEQITAWATDVTFLRTINDLIDEGIAVPTVEADGTTLLELDLTNI